MHLFCLGAARHGPAANAVAAVGLVSSMLPGALRGSLREAAETQRATAIIRLPSGRNARVVCAVTPLHPSDPDSPEQGGGSGGGARVLVASGACWTDDVVRTLGVTLSLSCVRAVAGSWTERPNAKV